jgi:hypothetical protein
VTVPFISTADLTDALGEDVTTSDLAVIALDSACQQVRDELNNRVNLVEDEEITLDGRGRYRLILPEPPVREVSEVVLDPGASTETTVDPTDYVLENGREMTGMFLRRISDVWPIGLGNIAVTYSHGWDVEESSADDFERVPSSIRQVALSLATRIFRSYGVSATSGGAVTSEQIGGYRYAVDAGSAVETTHRFLSTDEINRLGPYKVVAFV